MWEVVYHRIAVKHIRKLPAQACEKLDVWVEIATQEGPRGLRAFSGFNDEALAGDWKGYRSSRLNRQYRVVYSIGEMEISIFLVDVTAHDCRRP